MLNIYIYMFADVPPFAFDTQIESKYMEKLERIDSSESQPPPKWFGSKELGGNLQECMVASTVLVTRFLNIRQKRGSGRIYTAKKKNIHMFFWW